MGCDCTNKTQVAPGTAEETRQPFWHRLPEGFRSSTTYKELNDICSACEEYDPLLEGCKKDPEGVRKDMHMRRMQLGYCKNWLRPEPRKVTLRCPLSPGDVLTLTAAIESLHVCCPGEFLTNVDTTAPQIWENNPHITKTEGDSHVFRIDYPTINVSNQTSVCFIEGYTYMLGRKLGKPLRPVINRPVLYLSDEEKSWENQINSSWADELKGRKIPYWLMSAGVKKDFTAKQWPVEYYQEIVNKTRGLVQWVQIGSMEHDHIKIDGALDMRGKTDMRQMIRLAYHAQGGLGPVTLLQHLLAAFEKPYMCVLGGREPVIWTQYPLQHTFHTLGMLPCCRKAACWRSRIVPLPDVDSKNNSLCMFPVLGGLRPFGKCMGMITPDEVVTVLRKFV